MKNILIAAAVLSATFAFAEGDAIMDVYWIGKTLNNPWWISVADFATQEAEALGVNLTIAIPQEEVDLERQVSMIDAAVQSGAKADRIVEIDAKYFTLEPHRPVSVDQAVQKTAARYHALELEISKCDGGSLAAVLDSASYRSDKKAVHKKANFY